MAKQSLQASVARTTWLLTVAATLLILWAYGTRHGISHPSSEVLKESAQSAQKKKSFNRALFLHRAQSLGPETRTRAESYVQLIGELAQTRSDARAWTQRLSFGLSSLFSYAEDIEVWGQEDYWASPLEFVSKGRGDCEDFAIAGYYAMSSAGWPRSDLRLGYGFLENSGEKSPHVVLLVDSPEGQWVMDSSTKNIELTTMRPDLSIVYSFDAVSVYEGPHGPSVGSAAKRIPAWGQALSKAHAEGFD